MHQTNKNQIKVDMKPSCPEPHSQLLYLTYITPEKPLNMNPVQRPERHKKQKSETN
jgi:hypothetical protein